MASSPEHAGYLNMTTFEATDGQNLDRRAMGGRASPPMPSPVPDEMISSGAGPGDDDITASQKMVSAMSGSLMTSLLATPLDVVRVRWQSQTTPQGVSVDFSKLAMKTNTLNVVPNMNLGVTSCCREVFFMNSGAEYCLALPQRAASASAAAASSAAECAVEETERRTFSSTLDGFRKIARNEGITSLWRGLSPTLVMTIPANIIYFTGYDWLRFNKKSPFSQRLSDDTAPLVAGSVARTLAATAVNPIELFRTRMQASSGASTTGHLANTFKGVQEMVTVHGYTSLWRGLTLTLWRDVPFSGIYWWGYETIRGKLTDVRDRGRGRDLTTEDGSKTRSRRRSQSQENHTETFIDSFVAGATSGAIASVVTMPFDVGKTRTQVYQDGRRVAAKAAKSAVPEEGTMMQLLWHIFRNEGVAGLWKGWIPRTLKVAPACAIMISSYEIGKRTFRSINEKSRLDKEGGSSSGAASA